MPRSERMEIQKAASVGDGSEFGVTAGLRSETATPRGVHFPGVTYGVPRNRPSDDNSSSSLRLHEGEDQQDEDHF